MCKVDDKLDDQLKKLGKIETAMNRRAELEEELKCVREQAKEAKYKVEKFEERKEQEASMIFTFREWVMVAIALTSALAALATVALSYISS